VANIIINENSSIRDLTHGQFSSLGYNSTGNNYSGPLVQEIVNLIDRAGGDVTNTKVSAVGSAFRNIILNYQKKFKLLKTGILDDNLLHDIYKRANSGANNEINDSSNNNDDNNNSASSDLYDAHYDPFFLNNSSKVYRKNHKDIVISFGDGANTKTIKDVFMRSVSVQVDTSGNPISETYNFIARDIKESDASEDYNKYVGEESELSASSDIKYSYDTLFKDV
jgi:hypothetical protein